MGIAIATVDTDFLGRSGFSTSTPVVLVLVPQAIVRWLLSRRLGTRFAKHWMGENGLCGVSTLLLINRDLVIVSVITGRLGLLVSASWRETIGQMPQ